MSFDAFPSTASSFMVIIHAKNPKPRRRSGRRRGTRREVGMFDFGWLIFNYL